MKDKVIEIIGDSLNELSLMVDDVVYEKEGSNMFLRICLDSDEAIDINKIVLATKIINPLIDESSLINDKYILDIYGKSKGDLNEEA